MHKRIIISLIVLLTVLMQACTISYSFTGASIDPRVSTITIHDFNNQASYVYPPLAALLTEKAQDIYTRQTKLELTRSGGDLDLEGEITDWRTEELAVGEQALATETKLNITVRVRYTNKIDPEKDFERSFTAYQQFQSNQHRLEEVQDQLCDEILDEIVDQIYNATVADW